MSDRVVEELAEIAELLRRRVELAERVQEQQEGQRKQLEQRLDSFRTKLESGTADTLAERLVRDRFGPEHGEQMKRLHERAEESHRESREFRQKVVAEFERHNRRLEAILERLAHGK